MDKSTVMKNYRFLALMLFAMVAGMRGRLVLS